MERIYHDVHNFEYIMMTRSGSSTLPAGLDESKGVYVVEMDTLRHRAEWPTSPVMTYECDGGS